MIMFLEGENPVMLSRGYCDLGLCNFVNMHAHLQKVYLVLIFSSLYLKGVSLPTRIEVSGSASLS